MKLISFDIGIKNMAYCFFDISSEPRNCTSVLDWNVLNLMEAEAPTIPCSQCKTKITKSKKENLPCKLLAKYKKCGEYYCDKHAKACKEYILPTRQTSSSYLTTRKVDEVWRLACSLQLYSMDSTRPKKADIITSLSQYYSEHCFELVSNINSAAKK